MDAPMLLLTICSLVPGCTRPPRLLCPRFRFDRDIAQREVFDRGIDECKQLSNGFDLQEVHISYYDIA